MADHLRHWGPAEISARLSLAEGERSEPLVPREKGRRLSRPPRSTSGPFSSARKSDSLARGTESSNPSRSATQSVLPVNPAAASEHARGRHLDLGQGWPGPAETVVWRFRSGLQCDEGEKWLGTALIFLIPYRLGKLGTGGEGNEQDPG